MDLIDRLGHSREKDFVEDAARTIRRLHHGQEALPVDLHAALRLRNVKATELIEDVVRPGYNLCQWRGG